MPHERFLWKTFYNRVLETSILRRLTLIDKKIELRKTMIFRCAAYELITPGIFDVLSFTLVYDKWKLDMLKFFKGQLENLLCVNNGALENLIIVLFSFQF